MLIFVIFTYLILIFFVLFLGCVNKIQHLINVKLVSNTDVTPIFILNQNATSVQRQPDVILTSCASGPAPRGGVRGRRSTSVQRRSTSGQLAEQAVQLNAGIMQHY